MSATFTPPADANIDKDFVRRFLFPELDIRGAFVRLGPAWSSLQAGRHYPAAVARLLGEMTAVATLIGSQLKQAGRLTFQMQGQGPVKLLLVDCNENLDLRGMARCDPQNVASTSSDGELLGITPDGQSTGQLALILDLPTAREPYQSIVPLDGDSVASIFEHYLDQSEQQPTRLFLAATAEGVAGLFLQTLPGAAERDADGWNRITQLAATVRPEELLQLSPEDLLGRLFSEENVALFEARPVRHHCPEDWTKVSGMLLSLGREEVENMLQEHGEILIQDEICNREYRFDAAAVATLFGDPASPTLH